MNHDIDNYKFGERPPVPKPDPEILQLLGEDGIRRMAGRHYDLLRKSPLKKMFPSDDEAFNLAKQNSADFFIQLLGGPDYYNQRRGKPALVDRHSAFPITNDGRKIWLNCYKQALSETDIPEELKDSFWNYLNAFSNWMVNSYTKINTLKH